MVLVPISIVPSTPIVPSGLNVISTVSLPAEASYHLICPTLPAALILNLSLVSVKLFVSTKSINGAVFETNKLPTVIHEDVVLPLETTVSKVSVSLYEVRYPSCEWSPQPTAVFHCEEFPPPACTSPLKYTLLLLYGNANTSVFVPASLL